MKEIIIGKNQCGQRLDKFLAKYLRAAPKSFRYKMLRKKNIKRNGQKADGSEKLVEGDVVTLYLSDETIQKFSGDMYAAEVQVQTQPQIPLDIIYENEHIALINKPAGVLSQKAKQDDYSLAEQFVHYVGETEEGFRPGVCNRLDRNTSGLIVAGKTLPGLQRMSELIRSRDLKKYYLAVVVGKMQSDAIVEGYLRKDRKTNKAELFSKEVPGSSYIRTGYHTIYSDGAYTLLRVQLFTGKTHQIRSHLSSLSHPIAGDVKYGEGVPGSKIRRQLLHAYEIEFPEMEEMFADLSGRRFQARIPEDFYKEAFVRELLLHLE